MFMGWAGTNSNTLDSSPVRHGAKYRDKQPFTLRFTPMVYLEWTMNLILHVSGPLEETKATGNHTKRLITTGNQSNDLPAVRQEY